MNKIDILQNMSFGRRVAEEEANELSNYFVETQQWKQIINGEVDIIYGSKGAGKSAIYTLLHNRKDFLSKKNIYIVAAENPQGEIVFQELTIDPPTTEDEFRALWKLYFLILIGKFLLEQKVKDSKVEEVIGYLTEADLIRPNNSLVQNFKNVRRYIKGFFTPASVEGGVDLDPITGLVKGLKGKITPRDPTNDQEKKGFVSTDSLITVCDGILKRVGFSVWLILDRLDAAFEQNEDLEKNALRALFRVYLDFRIHTHISIKIFLRSDIWKKIVEGGFREASHITRSITIDWNNASLLNLIVKRLLKNADICSQYKIYNSNELMSHDAQERLFYDIFPNQVEGGEKKPKTLDWLLTRTCDGTRLTAPRELIHLLSEARNRQIQRIENGQALPSGNQLFDGVSLREALPEVSKVRLNQTFYAEYPQYKKFIQLLEGEKAEQNATELGKIWKISDGDALNRANELTELGFFEKRGTKENPTFWVPFLYREELKMIQGKSF